MLQQKLFEWGIFGLGDATAGMFLAHHFSKIGAYFGNNFEDQWPHNPLHRNPTQFETDLNHYMIKITNEISSGKLRNMSVLDLAGFGSKMAKLKKGMSSDLTWPTATNFAIYHDGMKNMSIVFNDYKRLIDLWDNHMENIDKGNLNTSLTMEMKNNKFFNFTTYITKDVSTFLKVNQTPYANLFFNRSL